MLAAFLGRKWSVLKKTEANHNNEIGVPLTLFNLRPDHQVAIVEMGMRPRARSPTSPTLRSRTWAS